MLSIKYAKCIILRKFARAQSIEGIIFLHPRRIEASEKYKGHTVYKVVENV